MLKPTYLRAAVQHTTTQPPSGGCVLKRYAPTTATASAYPAAFGRLCVETADYNVSPGNAHVQPPSGGCVLKLLDTIAEYMGKSQPPSGGCVLKRWHHRLGF